MTLKPTFTQAMLLPLFIATGSPAINMLMVSHHWDATSVLGGWCCILFLSALWLNHTLFQDTRMMFPPVVSLLATMLVWLWQRYAFFICVPSGELLYGYFLRPEGRNASFWVLSLPFSVGLSVIGLCFVAHFVLAWQAGARYVLIGLIPWWLAMLVIFSLPAVALDGQGNASIFI